MGVADHAHKCVVRNAYESATEKTDADLKQQVTHMEVRSQS